MNLIELSELLLDEKLAEQYLLEVGILKTFTNCDKCGSTKLGRIRRSRYKCYGCRSEWGIRKGSILHGQTITASKFIGLIKLFELDKTAKIASEELVINRKTALKFFELFRNIIVGDDQNAGIEDNLILKNESKIFSITILNDIVTIGRGNTNPSSKNLFTVRRTRVPNKEVTYYFTHGRIQTRSLKRKLRDFPITQNHFWRFANEKLLKFRGTKSINLFKFLKEIEFRYNSGVNLFNKIVSKIAKN